MATRMPYTSSIAALVSVIAAATTIVSRSRLQGRRGRMGALAIYSMVAPVKPFGGQPISKICFVTAVGEPVAKAPILQFESPAVQPEPVVTPRRVYRPTALYRHQRSSNLLGRSGGRPQRWPWSRRRSWSNCGSSRILRVDSGPYVGWDIGPWGRGHSYTYRRCQCWRRRRNLIPS